MARAAETRQVLDDANEVDLYRNAHGPAYDVILADQLPWPVLAHWSPTIQSTLRRFISTAFAMSG
jgi:hypothetical protein